MPPRQVLLIARDWALDGAERQLCYLAAGLDPARFTPLVLLDRHGPVSTHLASLGIAVHATPLRHWRRFPAALFRYYDALTATRWARRQDLALVHASDPWKAPHALFIARRLGLPAVVHVRGPVTARDVAKHHLRAAAAVITIAERYRAPLLSAGLDPARVHVIDDAVDLARFTPDAPSAAAFRARHVPPNCLAIGIVGRLEPFKRIVEFLEAAALVQAQLPNAATFLLIGQSGPDAYMQQVRATIARLNLAPHVVFTGRCADMPVALGSLDLLATFSGGSVMFEAMACARPVLSVRPDDQHSLHTRHNETALCVTTDQPAPAAAALTRLLQDAPLRTRLGTAARAWVAANLSPQTLVAQTQSVYTSALANL